ncbi:inovirus Gp2 family protein [Jinshanibacter sp. LJY008]|uniref:Inovirus Gp2 family protein n=1 Tax=Limnobaculum eriocheiris TaxID=2897391 RepID=A0A9X1MZW2_9GAMM|nr:inovirus Gp2 family protein [Limnobaculum eriocheiris]MCD1127675.1 inovirus Gp2 family protein [Limnobaculum eriocheiris]
MNIEISLPQVRQDTKTIISKLEERYGEYNHDWLDSIENVLEKALNEHPRTLAIRVDLHIPDDTSASVDHAVISRFIDSLKAKIKADLNRKKMEGKRVHPCSLRYAWVREFGPKNGKKHYHVLLLLNKDAYYRLGPYSQYGCALALTIRQAWMSALGVSGEQHHFLAQFPERPCYYLNANKLMEDGVYQELIARISYMLKGRTKLYGDGERNFGCSR